MGTAAGKLRRRRALASAIARTGLTRPLIKLRHRLLAGRIEPATQPGDDGYPLPPPSLLVGITGKSKSLAWYEESGAGDIDAIGDLLGAHGLAPEGLDTVLDFGCGCGRVTRRWLRYPEVRVSGCDSDPAMVAWCRDNLPFIEVRQNRALPPLPWTADSFSFAYAFSVFTHLDEPAHRPWLREMSRVLKPQGLILFSALGRSLAGAALDADEVEAFERDGLVIRHPELSGEALCTTYQSRAWTERALADCGFALVDRFDAERPFRGSHDFYLARVA